MNKILVVQFQGVTLYGFQVESFVFVALKPIVEGMGLAWEGQRQRVQRSPILSEGTSIIKVPFGRGGAQEMLCLRLDLVHGWLLTIDSTRIKNEELRRRVETYQRECHRVLFAHFSGESEKLWSQQHDSESLRLRKVAECRQIFGEIAAAQLWKQLGMTWVPGMDCVVRQYDLFSRPTEAETIDFESSRRELERIGSPATSPVAGPPGEEDDSPA
jgi:hypothetical protein